VKDWTANQLDNAVKDSYKIILQFGHLVLLIGYWPDENWNYYVPLSNYVSLGSNAKILEWAPADILMKKPSGHHFVLKYLADLRVLPLNGGQLYDDLDSTWRVINRLVDIRNALSQADEGTG